MFKWMRLFKRDAATDQFKEIPLNHIVSNPYQPRRKYDEESLKELSLSILKYGVIQPVVVRKHGDLFELVSGERRVRASRMAGLDKIPALVGNFSDSEMLEIGLLENIQRENLTVLEEAMGYASMVSFLKPSTQKEMAEEISKRLGKKQADVYEKLMLLSYLPVVQKALDYGFITLDHAKLIDTVKGDEKKKEALEKILYEGFSLKQTENLIRKQMEGWGELRVDQIEELDLPARERETLLLFIHILKNAVDALKEFGVDAHFEMDETLPLKIVITCEESHGKKDEL